MAYSYSAQIEKNYLVDKLRILIISYFPFPKFFLQVEIIIKLFF